MKFLEFLASWIILPAVFLQLAVMAQESNDPCSKFSSSDEDGYWDAIARCGACNQEKSCGYFFHLFSVYRAARKVHPVEFHARIGRLRILRVQQYQTARTISTVLGVRRKSNARGVHQKMFVRQFLMPFPRIVEDLSSNLRAQAVMFQKT